MSAPTHSVLVSGFGETTTQAQLNDFFTFCGKITSIDFNASEKTATIHFEKPTAAKTALMLNGGTLDGTTITVTSDVAHEDEAHEIGEGPDLAQEHKPRAGIAAEYLAKGYTLSDQILQRMIELDTKQGISQRFLAYIKSLDTTIGAKTLGPDQTISAKIQAQVAAATQHAKTVDEQKGYTKTAHDYYVKALSSPFGKKIFDFYTTTSKQALDIHEEAKRLAEHQKAQQAAPPAPSGDVPPAAAAQ